MRLRNYLLVLAVRPPEYFPRPAYAALLLAARRVVLADTLPFSRQGYQNRARLRTPHGAGWEWLTVPRRHGPPGQPLTAVAPDAAVPWARRHRRALHVNYALAPYYDHHADALDALFARTWPSLADLTCATVVWLHGALGAPSELVRASELPGAPATVDAIWRALDDRPRDALLTFPESAPRDAARLAGTGADVRMLRFEEPVRVQNFPGFVAGTSALDLVLNHGPATAGLLRRGVQGWAATP